jgi:hypothetical protein
MATAVTAARVVGELAGGEDELPAERPGRLGILAVQRVGQADSAFAAGQIALVEGFAPARPGGEIAAGGAGEHDDTILAT